MLIVRQRKPLKALSLPTQFIQDPFRHLKPILVIGAGQHLLEKAAIPMLEEDTGLITAPSCSPSVLAEFIQPIAVHRHPTREQLST